MSDDSCLFAMQSLIKQSQVKSCWWLYWRRSCVPALHWYSGFSLETLSLAKVVPAVRQQAHAEVLHGIQLCLTFHCKESAYIKVLQGKTSSAQWGNFKIYFILSARWLLRHCRGLANLKLYSFATIECRSYQMCLQRFSRIKFFDLHMSFAFCCFLFPTVFALDKL